ncbi:Neuroserpin [Manis pentadactyla]|nr:Neuroserpin [Manis pentadactyla]
MCMKSGEIKGLLSPNILTSSDQLVLVNAISFRGTWKYAFQKGQTQTMAFQLDDVVSCQNLFFSYRFQGHILENSDLQEVLEYLYF